MTSSTPAVAPSLAALARSSGALGMVAMDQREGLRQMFKAATGHRDIPDLSLVDFKRAVAEHVGKHASGFLIDVDFGFADVAASGVLPSSCGLIVAADQLTQHPDGPVHNTAIDPRVDLDDAREAGAVAAKLLVIWRQDASRDRNVELVADFVARCAAAGLLSVVEPVVRPTAEQDAGNDFDNVAAIAEAAAAVGAVRPDLYKAQVPTRGPIVPDELIRECERLTSIIRGPWVVLSQGVEPAAFPVAVRSACRGGASGFLAGRAIWSSAVGTVPPIDLARRLSDTAVPALQRLLEIVDEYAGPWWQAPSRPESA